MKNPIDFEALYESSQLCQRGVIWKDSVASFSLDALKRTMQLKNALTNSQYKPRPPHQFWITHPKKRLAASIGFKDRVYQRSLNDNCLYPQITRHFIYDNAACQKDRGTDFARGRLKAFLEKAYRKYGIDLYILQCDIKGYYPNMRHDAVEMVFGRYLDPETFRRSKEVLNGQYEGDVGFFPGSQMIQIAGIAILNDMDHMIKERLRVKYYLRYMDDFVLIHPDKEFLLHCRDEIEKEVEKIGFWLHPEKTRLYPISEGIKFLGFIHYLTDTGKVLRLLDTNNVRMERRKLVRLVHRVRKGYMTRKQVDNCYQSWRAHAVKGNTHNLVRRMDKFYESLWNKPIIVGERNNKCKQKLQ